MADLKEALAELAKKGWAETGKKLHKEYKFKTFTDAFAFMKTCAPEIEKLDHHPEWLNVYNKVTVDLTTHDKGGITAKDVELAKIMDRIFIRFSS